MKGFWNSGSSNVDEHDLPTQPILTNGTVPAPFAPTVANSPGQGRLILPEPSPYESPFPLQGGLAPQAPVPYPPAPYPYAPQGGYPYMPPASIGQPWPGDRSTNGAAPFEPARARRERRSVVPALVGLFFVLVQILLLARFVLKIINLPPGGSVIGAIYDGSSLFIWPVQALIQQVQLPFPVYIEVYTLLSILLYGILSRIIVRLLKAIMHSH